MLTPTERGVLRNHLQGSVSGPIDTRVLIGDEVTTLSPLIPGLNRHHVAGMLAALKRGGATFTVIDPGKLTIVSP